MARRDPLERVGDKVPCAAPRVELGFLLELANAAGELMADPTLCTLEELRLGLVDRQAGDPLELAKLPVLRVLEIDLELLDVRLAIGEALLAAKELGQLHLELVLLRKDTLLKPGDLAAALLGVELGLAAQVFRFPLRVVDQLVAPRGSLPEARPAEHLHHHEQESRSEDKADSDSGGDEHGLSWGRLPHHQARAERSDLAAVGDGRTVGAASEL